MHDLNLISRYADLVGLMVHGKLEAVGKAEEVLRSDLLSRAYQLPLEVIREKGFTLVTPGMSEDEPAKIP